MSKRNSRKFVSISMLAAIIFLLVSAVVMIVLEDLPNAQPVAEIVSIIHEIIGFIFICISVFHIAFNRKVLKSYLT